MGCETRTVPPLMVTGPTMAGAVGLLSTRVPVFTVVRPGKVFVPVNWVVPVPVKVMLPLLIGPLIVKPGVSGVPDATLMVVLLPPKLRGPIVAVPGDEGLTMKGLVPVRVIGGVRVVPPSIVRAGGAEPVLARVKGPVPVTVAPVLTVMLLIVVGAVGKLRFPPLFTTTLLKGPI